MSPATVPLATLANSGPDLVVTTSSELLADHYWLSRSDLLRLSGQHRFVLVVQLDPESEPLQLFWSPAPLPVSLTVPATFRQP